MDEVLYQLPCYTQEIINSLIDRDWFIHSFDLQNVHDIYNPAGYLYHSEFEDIEYSIFLDLNIYQYVLSSTKKQNKNQLHRDAIALIVFARLANMNFDPTLAVYEKLNYLEECPDDLIDDLELFRRIDDSELEDLAKFALGLENSFPVIDIAPIDKENLKSELTRYRRLKKWDTFYLFVLKIVELYFFNSSSNEEKIRRFLQWSFRDFKYSLVAISFVLKLLGDRPKAKLMKYKLSQNAAEKQDAIVNMTWDLFLLDTFFENWVKKTSKKEFIYASNDKPLKEVLEIAISIQKHEGFDHLKGQLSSRLIKELGDIKALINRSENRNIKKVTDFQQFRDKLINSLEIKLLHSNVL